jgi:hypothetical protein
MPAASVGGLIFVTTYYNEGEAADLPAFSASIHAPPAAIACGQITFQRFPTRRNVTS